MDPPPSDNLWIGGLPPTLDKAGLQALLAPYGTVADCRVLPPKSEGMTSSAMVRFSSLEEASWLQSQLNGNMLEGLETPIIVKFANPPKNRPQGAFAQAPGAYVMQPTSTAPAEVPPSDNLWIGGLPPALDQQGLQDLFARYGSVQACRLLPPRYEGATSSGMVRFSSMEEASWLVSTLNGNIPEGLDAPIIVKFANPPKNQHQQQQQQQQSHFNQHQVVPAAQARMAPGPYSGGPQVISPPGGGKAGGHGKDSGAMVAKGYGKAKGVFKGPSPGTFKRLFENVSDRFGAMPAPLENQVYVNGLPGDTTDFDLYRLFSPFGAVAPNGVKAMLGPDGSCKGFGFVDFVEVEAAGMAVAQLDGFESDDGTLLRCSIKAPSTSKGKGKSNAMMGGMDALNGGEA